jgi:hypothetical protein
MTFSSPVPSYVRPLVGTFVVVFALMSLHQAVPASAGPAGRDFRSDPPKVASASVKPLPASGQGRLEVRFSETGLPATIPLTYQSRRRLLRDDGQGGDRSAGDGTYSAIVDLEAAPVLAKTAAATTALALTAPAWEVGVAYAVGTLVTHEGLTYKCLQAHTSQSDWAPPIVPALWEPQDDGGLDPERTLLIRHTSVVSSSRTSDPCLTNDPAHATRKWTFGYLMTQIANTPQTGRTPHDVAMSLLTQWERTRAVNGETVPARTAIRQRVIDKWLRASGNTGTLAMHKAPFRLLAIVNRIDLRQNLFFGEGLAGEMRFVWGVLDLESRAADGTCQEDPSFTFIMEYAVDRPDATAVKAWGQKWVDLGAHDVTTETFRASLQSLTESVVKAGAGAAAGRANGSALIRIRTNEISIGSPWELREFALVKAPDANAGRFVPVSVKQTPAVAANGTQPLAQFVNDNEAAILADRHNVPLQFQGAPFRGGHSLNNIDFWNADGIRSPRARHLLSFNTCNGCHGAETATSFLHVFPRSRSLEASLSGFLTGLNVADPVDGATTRHINDLFRRGVDLHRLTSSPTLSQLAFQPLGRTH